MLCDVLCVVVLCSGCGGVDDRGMRRKGKGGGFLDGCK